MNTYAYVGSNPLKWTDPLGLDYGFGVDPNAAGGNGHTTLYYQDPTGNWNSYDQGARGDTSSGGNSGFLGGSDADAGVRISPIHAPPSNAQIYPSDPSDDAKISQCANDSQKNHNSGKDKYNLYSNNCTDAGVDVLTCADYRVSNPPFTIRPNSWLDHLKKNPPKRCKQTSRGVRCQ